jgi:ABC-type branched-subunit amino acid transport system substrate-binding protein
MPSHPPRRHHRHPLRPGLCARAASLAWLVGAGLGLGACSSNPPTLASAGTASLPARSESAVPPVAPKPPVKVALLVPLTGPGQTPLLAEALKRAAELAVGEPQAAHIELIVRDDKGTREGAAAAAQEALAAGAEIVLGPLLAPAVGGAETVTRARGVPILAFSTDRQVAGRNVHLLSFLSGPEVQRVVGHAVANGRKRIAALLPDDAYGRILEVSLREAAARSGAAVVVVEKIGGEAGNALQQAVRRLRDAMRGIEEHGDPVDALFLAGGEETLPTLAPLLTQAGFDPDKTRVLGTGALDYAGVGREAMLQGAWFATPEPRGWREFAARYGKAHGQAPPRIAALAYDAIGVVATLSAGPPGARFIPASLTRPNGFVGIDGAFRFLQDGTIDRALAVMEVQAGGPSVVEAAPAGFDGGGLAAPRPTVPSAARASVGTN